MSSPRRCGVKCLDRSASIALSKHPPEMSADSQYADLFAAASGNPSRGRAHVLTPSVTNRAFDRTWSNGCDAPEDRFREIALLTGAPVTMDIQYSFESC